MITGCPKNQNRLQFRECVGKDARRSCHSETIVYPSPGLGSIHFFIEDLSRINGNGDFVSNSHDFLVKSMSFVCFQAAYSNSLFCRAKTHRSNLR